MKAPVGLLSDRTVLRSKMEGPRPDKFAFAKRSAAMKAPVGLLSDRTVLRSKMEGPRPDKFRFVELSRAYHTQLKIAKAGYHRHDDTLPLLVAVRGQRSDICWTSIVLLLGRVEPQTLLGTSTANWNFQISLCK